MSAGTFMTQQLAIPTAASLQALHLKKFLTAGPARFAASAKTVFLSWNKPS